MKATPATAAPPREDRLLLLEEVADLCRASLGSVRHWIQVGKLKALRPGRRVLVRRSDLDAFLDGGRLGGGATT